MTQERATHWETVYSTKAVDEVSWYQQDARPSLDAIERNGGLPAHSFIDIGGGASPLAAMLAQRGWSDLAVLDISSAALEKARAAMGDGAQDVEWIVADITAWQPSRVRDVWHDRAVFHFLTDPADRQAYHRALASGLAPGGLLVMATFAPDGPERCSGLPVVRYDAASLSAELGPQFRLVQSWGEQHATPGGSSQSFSWCVFRKVEP